MTLYEFIKSNGGEVLLGYIRIVVVDGDWNGTEKLMANLTASELAFCLEQKIASVYRMGEYFHIVLSSISFTAETGGE